MSDKSELVKVQLSGPDGDVETLWAKPVGDDLYELDNTPWYAYGVSWKDVIEARPAEPDAFPEFIRVVRKSGYRTIRLILEPSADKDQSHSVYWIAWSNSGAALKAQRVTISASTSHPRLISSKFAGSSLRRSRSGSTPIRPMNHYSRPVALLPNKRLKLTARADYGMNLSSARRSLSAIR